VSRLVLALLARPRLTVTVWAAAVAVLGLLSIGLEDRLAQTNLVVPGSESARHFHLAQARFHGSEFVPVVLEGPPKALDEQGPRLAAALRRRPGVDVVSPWDAPRASTDLRPSRRAAMLLANVTPPDRHDLFTVLRPVEAIVKRVVKPPVTAHVTGDVAVGRGLNEASLQATKTAEMIALPVLALVLLLVFRSPVAAGIPVVLGVATVLSGFGLLSLLARVFTLDAFAASLASMMGLALGVDYSLLLVSRFRERSPASRQDVRVAAELAGATAGRTVVFAGAVVLAAMILLLLLGPGSVLVSSAVGVIVVVLVSVISAVGVIPAMLVLLGGHLDRWSVGRSPDGRPGAIARAGEALARRPLVLSLAILAGLAALSGQALALETTAPSADLLPSDSRARQDFHAARRVFGPGYGAVVDVIFVAHSGTITERARLRSLERLQRRLVRDPGVATVIGPGPLERETADVAQLPRRLASAGRDIAGAHRRVRALGAGLGDVNAGVAELRAALDTAADGASRLHDGAARSTSAGHLLAGQVGSAGSRAQRMNGGLLQASDGAGQMAQALARARRAVERLHLAVSQAARGSARVTDGLRRSRAAFSADALPSVRQLADGLGQGAEGVAALRQPVDMADTEVRRAFAALRAMTIGKSDPRYRDAVRSVGRAYGAVTGLDPVSGEPVEAGYAGLRDELSRLSTGLAQGAADARRLEDGGRRLLGSLGELERGAASLRGGLRRLDRGTDELPAGLRRLRSAAGSFDRRLGELHDGADQLSTGLRTLASGARRLADGTGSVAGGVGALRSGLAAGDSRSGGLSTGLRRGRRSVDRFAEQLDRLSPQRLGRRSPGLARSGHLVLAALDGASPRDRDRAGIVVNLDDGGQAARILVVPKTGLTSPATGALRDRVARQAHDVARRTGVDTAVGGSAGTLSDYNRATAARLPVLVAALSGVTFVMLVLLLRALLLPLIAVALNLLTVGATFGVLALGFQGPAPPLGGPGRLDVLALTGIFAIVFALSIDYQVFLLARMREGWVRYRDAGAAIQHGLRHTAKVVTGAAGIMTAVFVAFALTDFITIRQFGVGLAVAVVLDSIVVRLILLPGLMKVAGRWAWWLPPGLDRLLPSLQRATA
jgi:putative drug exporter of the RND superfamily